MRSTPIPPRRAISLPLRSSKPVSPREQAHCIAFSSVSDSARLSPTAPDSSSYASDVVLEASSEPHRTRGTSSAVASVLFTRGGDHTQVTKSGSYIYHGDAATFHEWEFRTRLRVKTAGTDPDRYADAMSKVVDGLRGDAFIIAKEVGLERLWFNGGVPNEEQYHYDGDWDTTYHAGVDVLIDSIRESVFPLTTYEAKELFRQYCKPGGSLARQNGEIDATVHIPSSTLLEIVT